MTLLDIRCDHILEINLAARVTGLYHIFPWECEHNTA